MNILLADDEPLLLRKLERAVKEALPSAVCNSFSNANDALAYAKENKIDIAFLDIEMRGMTGLALAKELVSLNTKTNIVFCTGYTEYAVEAFDAYASNYLMKPISSEMIKKSLQNLRHPIEARKRVRFSCFGNFEAYCDGEPIRFSLTHTKELLAYLVDRNGAVCNAKESIAVLFGDNYNREYYKKIRQDLIKTFNELKISDCLVIVRGGLGIARDSVECDYFDYKDGKTAKKPTEYMTQYSFAEETFASLVM